MSTVRDLRRITRDREATRAVRPVRPREHCDLCGTEVEADHRHLRQIEERQILCVCESCFALRAGDAVFKPTGRRVVWLTDFDLPEEIWAAFRIPIGLAFFFDSSSAGAVTALYPSPAGATESELDLSAWEQLALRNPILQTLDEDAEALIVNRMREPYQFAIAPIDRCYGLVGLVKTRWVGISGGTELKDAIQGYFDELREAGG